MSTSFLPYQQKCIAVGAHPDDLRTLTDLAPFPFTTKEDLRAGYPFGLFAVPRTHVVRVHASSGTTGKPTVVGYTARDIETWALLMARSIRAAGGRPGDIVHVAYGYGLFTGGLGAHYGAEKLGCTVVPMSGGQTEKQVQLIIDFAPDLIMVTPSYMLNICEEFVRQGVDPRACSLKIGIFGAEPWTEAMRGDIEQRVDIDAVDIYGLSEVMGPGVACECIEAKDGAVIWEDHFYAEIRWPTLRPYGTRLQEICSAVSRLMSASLLLYRSAIPASSSDRSARRSVCSISVVRICRRLPPCEVIHTQTCRTGLPEE